MIVVSKTMLTMAKSSNKKIVFGLEVAFGTFSARSTKVQIFPPGTFGMLHLVYRLFFLMGVSELILREN